MGPLAQFLLALTNLVRSGIVKKIPDAIKFAEQQFGKVTPLLKKQIEKVFESAKKPVVGKPGKKEGTVLPFVKKTEGIETLDEFNLSKDDPMGDLEKIIKGEGDTGLPKEGLKSFKYKTPYEFSTAFESPNSRHLFFSYELICIIKFLINVKDDDGSSRRH